MKLTKLTQINLISHNNSPKPFVLGGSSINQSSLDYNLVSLEYKGLPKCLGTLFASNYLVTSAQCNFGDIKDWKLTTFNADINRGSDDSNVDKDLDFKQKDKVTHFDIIDRQTPQHYNSTLMSFDFTIWETQPLSYPLKNVTFHSKETVFGKYLISIGINSSSTKYTEQSNLVLLNQTHLPSKYCREQFYESYDIILNSRDHICFGGMYKGEQEMCQGNLGAPLFYQTEDNLVLIGVNSYSDGCKNLELPGIFSYVNEEDINELLDDAIWGSLWREFKDYISFK
ncbi:trypsin-like serine protease [Conidiobolus coronatus NRRL 28638]|uniref:Trypsin-like serine protease n=1 Tax=Conidiobolus coronatus (strain ATCC 28846 / CBS 209.66 / NRRL 28638) TaxID=796925 RepID=A0A137NWB8_CONC2|nr:trypsin-like serine protease [Conidiobolus coronatus NRRL 28638]|eukprot:KXN67076.1 trypsin-like serine protease [Conidiobolus coronatus NRRL 28638]